MKTKLERCENKNAARLHCGDLTILFSYETPVALFDNSCGLCLRTAEQHSVTTSRHVNLFLADYNVSSNPAKTRPQDWFDKLLQPVDRSSGKYFEDSPATGSPFFAK